MHPAREFNVYVSINDFVLTTGSNGDEYIANHYLEKALNELGVSVDICSLYFQYFNEIEIGKGNVYLYTNSNEPENIFVIDMYRELTDQLDIVSFSVRCSDKRYPKVSTHLRNFFEGAMVQGGLEQLSRSSRLHTLINEKTYPFLVAESGYMQVLINVGNR
ncbi:MAG: hypothetical protein EOO07_15565 [Chitinophagaceae bacterium]|nr:MAG: hypothetical protein EOO07_15565 [Chitinophagaceae bacterium]